jgi:cholesterol transport system auxiliary component
MRVPARVSRRWAPTIMALALAGCGSLFGGGQPTQLYRVTPVRTFPPDLPQRPVQLLIDVPLAPAGLDTSRIALTRSAVSIEYFADTEWTDRVPLMVQTDLLESFENSKTVKAIERESAGLGADLILKTEIRHFEALYNSPQGAPVVWVAIMARLVNPTGRDIIAQNTFERHEPASENQIPAIVVAFDQALGAVIEDIVVWTARNPALSAKRRSL